MVLETVILILKRAVSFDNQYRNYFPNNLFLYQYMGFLVSLLTYIERICLRIYWDYLFLVICSNEDTSKKLATDHAQNTFWPLRYFEHLLLFLYGLSERY